VPDLAQEDEQERASDRSMRLRALRSAVRELADRDQRRVVWLVLEGDGVPAIAHALGMTQTRVAELLAEAEAELRELMG